MPLHPSSGDDHLGVPPAQEAFGRVGGVRSAARRHSGGGSVATVSSTSQTWLLTRAGKPFFTAPGDPLDPVHLHAAALLAALAGWGRGGDAAEKPSPSSPRADRPEGLDAVSPTAQTAAPRRRPPLSFTATASAAALAADPLTATIRRLSAKRWFLPPAAAAAAVEEGGKGGKGTVPYSCSVAEEAQQQHLDLRCEGEIVGARLVQARLSYPVLVSFPCATKEELRSVRTPSAGASPLASAVFPPSRYGVASQCCSLSAPQSLLASLHHTLRSHFPSLSAALEAAPSTAVSCTPADRDVLLQSFTAAKEENQVGGVGGGEPPSWATKEALCWDLTGNGVEIVLLHRVLRQWLEGKLRYAWARAEAFQQRRQSRRSSTARDHRPPALLSLFLVEMGEEAPTLSRQERGPRGTGSGMRGPEPHGRLLAAVTASSTAVAPPVLSYPGGRGAGHLLLTSRDAVVLLAAVRRICRANGMWHAPAGAPSSPRAAPSPTEGFEAWVPVCLPDWSRSSCVWVYVAPLVFPAAHLLDRGRSSVPSTHACNREGDGDRWSWPPLVLVQVAPTPDGFDVCAGVARWFWGQLLQPSAHLVTGSERQDASRPPEGGSRSPPPVPSLRYSPAALTFLAMKLANALRDVQSRMHAPPSCVVGEGHSSQGLGGSGASPPSSSSAAATVRAPAPLPTAFSMYALLCASSSHRPSCWCHDTWATLGLPIPPVSLRSRGAGAVAIHCGAARRVPVGGFPLGASNGSVPIRVLFASRCGLVWRWTERGKGWPQPKPQPGMLRVHVVVALVSLRRHGGRSAAAMGALLVVSSPGSTPHPIRSPHSSLHRPRRVLRTSASTTSFAKTSSAPARRAAAREKMRALRRLQQTLIEIRAGDNGEVWCRVRMPIEVTRSSASFCQSLPPKREPPEQLGLLADLFATYLPGSGAPTVQIPKAWRGTPSPSSSSSSGRCRYKEEDEEDLAAFAASQVSWLAASFVVGTSRHVILRWVARLLAAVLHRLVEA
eukprot:gene6368-4593_t